MADIVTKETEKYPFNRKQKRGILFAKMRLKQNVVYRLDADGKETKLPFCYLRPSKGWVSNLKYSIEHNLNKRKKTIIGNK